MSKHSTSYQLAARYREQVEAAFAPTKRQIPDDTKEGRHQLLRHLSKLYRKVQGRSDLALRIEGRI